MRTPTTPATLGIVLIAAYLSFLPALLTAQSAPPDATTNAATAAFGGCPAPSHAGVKVCFPFIFPGVAIASPFQLIASGTGAGGPVKLMEVWADGKKITQMAGSLFDAPVTLPSGSHRITVVELDTTGAFLKATPFTISVQGSTAGQACAPPGSPGVNDCEPGVGGCNTNGWTTIIASGTPASGVVSRMELWVNGVKLANFSGNLINTNLYLPDFTRVVLVEVDTNGGFVKSLPIIVQSC